MKIPLLLALAGLAISFALPTFAQQTVDPKIEQQIRALAAKYDEAFNRNDAAAVAALYAQDGVNATPHAGTFHGRQAIEENYAKWDFQRWHARNFVKTIDRVVAVGNEVRAYGTWRRTYQETTSAPRDDEGHFVWVLVRDGDTWKIRRDTASESTSTPQTENRNPAATSLKLDWCLRKETMKMRLVVALTGLAFGFAAPAFAQQTDTNDPQIAEQLRAEAKKFEEAYIQKRRLNTVSHNHTEQPIGILIRAVVD